MTDAKYPRCDSYHDTVHGFKEHYINRHGRWPGPGTIMKAKALALEGPEQ